MGGTASVVKKKPTIPNTGKYVAESVHKELPLDPDHHSVRASSKKSIATSGGDSRTLVEIFSSLSLGSARSLRQHEQSLRLVDLEKASFRTPADSSYALLSPDPSTVVNCKPEEFKLLDSISHHCELLRSNSVARKLFIRFIKENPSKWLEQLAIYTQQKMNSSNRDLSSGIPNRSTSVSPMASPTNRSGKGAHSNSQYFSSTVLNFHSYTVSKPIIFQNASMEQSSHQVEERHQLDITDIMKQLKIKDSLEANALLASNSQSVDSYDNSTVVHSHGVDALSSKGGKLSKVLNSDGLEAFLYAALIPIFSHSTPFQTMKANNWSADLLDQISFGSGGSIESSCLQDLRISTIIQQSRTQLKNESLANLQELFFALSKELREEQMQQTLSANGWVENISSCLSNCPFGIIVNRNMNAMNFLEVPSTDEEEDIPLFARESLPIVYSNNSVTDLTGYSSDELFGSSLSALLPKPDQKILQLPKQDITNKSRSPTATTRYYNDRRLVQKYLDYSRQGEKIKVGLINERKDHTKFYDFISTLPIRSPKDQQYRYLISLHYHCNPFVRFDRLLPNLSFL